MGVFRCYTEKKEPYNIEAKAVFHDLSEFLGVSGLEKLRVLSRYDVDGISPDTYFAARETVFSSPQTDDIFDELLPDPGANSTALITEALPGQYDQRAETCAKCLQVISLSGLPIVKTAKVYIFYGNISGAEMDKIRGYLINRVESREASWEKPESLKEDIPKAKPVETIHGFIDADSHELLVYLDNYNMAMDRDDICLTQEYFRSVEKRDPTVTELRVLDTYWSDHCRHTTFHTHITDLSIDDPKVAAAYETYQKTRREVYGESAGSRPVTLMDIATINAKFLRKRGLLTNMEISEEVNACSIHINAVVDGKIEDWLLMFKNETHNHPTEAEPFGGAATCVGGIIRDPMSGRAFVYQGMRVTGAGNPLTGFADTLPGKLAQKKLTGTAALGNSSYGNQIGLASGLVHELYHPGYVAKRMELGAVVGAVKAENVLRGRPVPGDKVILVGGRTGRDGIGGATGSSKSQTEKSLVTTMASEVQKGDAAEERKIQRLFLDPVISRMIKRCNDFGAGGVSVAVGELADGLDIDLSLVRCKYEGLDGTEIAISESQERMAVVVSATDVDTFIKKAEDENLEAYVIAEISESPRVVMRFDSKIIVDLSREFLSTNGAVKTTSVKVPALNLKKDSVERQVDGVSRTQGSGGCAAPDASIAASGTPLNDISFAERFKALVSDLRFCSQLGLSGMFDGTAGAAAVLEKNGGKTRSSPIQAMAALLPVLDGETTTCSVMAYGYDPYLSAEDPFTGAKTAVVTSVAKLVAAGCDPDDAYLTFQEYFENLRNDPTRWGKPFSALLGAFEAQMELDLAAIGGKDSMSGSFGGLDVPPALISFAIAPCDAADVISPEFKQAGHDVVVFETGNDLAAVKETWKKIHSLVKEKTIVSAWVVTEGGLAEGIFKMSLGNEIGFEFSTGQACDIFDRFSPGSVVAEVIRPVPVARVIGRTTNKPQITAGGEVIGIAELRSAWENTLESVFPTKTGLSGTVNAICNETRPVITAGERFAKPRALIFAFPGSSGEFTTARAVSRAGGDPHILVIRNKTPVMLEDSIAETVGRIRESQIIIVSGGFLYADEPDGAAKFIAQFLRNQRITEALHEHIKTRDGLMLGLCNGFQAFLKLGLVPFGEILPPNAGSPALTRNAIGRFQAGYFNTRIASVNSPWVTLCNVGDVHAVAVAHGEGRFIASEETMASLIDGGQVATQYSDPDGVPSMDTFVNPDGSKMAVEGIFSPDGRVFGKMGHTDRYGIYAAKNIPGNKYQPVFESGIYYYK